MKSRILSVALLCGIFILFNAKSYSQNASTTFILVRHAEKDLTQSTNDPDLAPEGKIRAEKLKMLFRSQEITGIYSTPYKRTKQTVAPLAADKGMEVTAYQPMDYSIFSNLVKQNQGGKVVVSGHSNTIPALINYLTGTEKYKILEEGEYDKIFIVTVDEIGDATVVVLNN